MNDHDANAYGLDRYEDALGDLWSLLGEGEELGPMLQRLVEIAVRLFPPGYEASITIVANTDRGETVATTDPEVLALDRAQYDSGDGPCLEAAEKRAPVRTDVEGARARWPEFADAAMEVGILGYLAAPLVIQPNGSGSTEVIGSFNLYSRKAESFDAFDAALLMLFTNSVLAAVATSQSLVRARQLADGLRTAMKSRSTIDHAIGMVMARRRVGADEAFQLLSRESQDSNVKLRDLALKYVESASNAATPP
jgi:ANTAR domain/GAF domain